MSNSSAVIAVTDDQVITGFDANADIHWCSPKVIGFSVCVDASATAPGGVPLVELKIQLKTPVGNVSKSFSFGKNTCWTWDPFYVVSVQFCSKNLTVTSSKISFELSVKFCINYIFDKECDSVSHKFDISLGSDSTLHKLSAGEFSEEQVTQAMILRLLLDRTKESGDCNCH